MSEIQWSSIAGRLKLSSALQELSMLPRYSSCKASKVMDLSQVANLLSNGWATETLLHQTKNSFSGDALRNSLLWGFPQVYYSIFAVGSAYFRASGFTEGYTHASFLKKFSDEVALKHYPAVISPYMDGGIEKVRTIHNLSPTPLPTSLYFMPSDPGCLDAHIKSLLNSTRHMDLRDRLLDMKLKTKTNSQKKKFTYLEYSDASRRIGKTSILDFLYRKRIKANYQDIDSILSSALNPNTVFDSLVEVVGTFNGVHEGYIKKMIGDIKYSELLQCKGASRNPSLAQRTAEIRRILK